MPVLTPIYQDFFSPTLFASEALEVSVEQKHYIKEVLDIACSDTRFAQKAYDAMILILTGGSVDVPVVASLNPATATLGAASFTLSVLGEKFDVDSKIIWNGSEEATTVVSDTEVTTMVDMTTAIVAADIPVQVRNSTGALSNIMTFSITNPALMAMSQKKATPEHKVAEVKTENKVIEKK